MRSPGQTLDVVVLAYDGCYGSEVFAFADLLRIANHAAAHLGDDGDAAPFDVRIAGARGGSVGAAAGGPLAVAPEVGTPDLVVVPGFDLWPVDAMERRLQGLGPEVDLIREVMGAVPVASVCVGAFLLGEAGLLDGRRATTSWLFADQLAERYPAAFVDASAMVVEDAGITTTAAFSAASDLAMSVIAHYAGDEVARLAARVTLLGDQRDSQAPYVDPSLLRRPASSIAEDVRAWLASHMDEPYGLARLAAEFHMSTRTLLRRFRDETGSSPLQHLQQMRVDRAKQLLETTDLRLHEIVARVGYADQAAFRKLFRAHTAMTPTSYRRRFHRI